jgi:hypothetical protein
MGTGTGRRNKLTSESAKRQQTASQQPSSLTILTVRSDSQGRWVWAIELDGKTYTSGVPPATGPAVFNERNQALDSVGLNHSALEHMAKAQRSRERAARAMEAEQSAGE